MKSIREAEVAGKKVLLRADLDGPIKRLERGRGWESVDEAGLETTLPTIKFLVEQGTKTIVIGHLDRPGGKVVENLRLDPVAKKLSEYLPAIHKVDGCVGPEVEKAVGAMAPGDVLLLENIRFNKGEVKGKPGTVPGFARQLADLADLYVNDCFAASHRRHASIVGVPKLLPSYAGLQLEKETMILRRIIVEAERPLLFIIGGAKAETKAPLVKKLSKTADKILLGGTLMFEKSLERIPNVIFPVDAVGVEDIGPQTIKMFTDEIKKANTIVWNGPLGVTNTKEFEVGTRKIAEALAESGALTVVGGGDTDAALTRFGLRDKMGFVSSGGGAMLQFLADGTLPGLEALR